MSLLSIAHKFTASEDVVDIRPYGNGLINETHLVSTDARQFILQRINQQVFPNVEQIMDNLQTLDTHLHNKTAAELKLQFPHPIRTADRSELLYYDAGHCWRALTFIENTESVEFISSIAEAEQAGYALGHFHRLFSDLNPASLHDTLPGFHITPDYLENYHQVLTTTSLPTQACAAHQFIQSHQEQATVLENAKQQGLLVQRVIHGDPKLNNILFDKDTCKAVSIIDLDTVKPGLVHYDLGDCLRSCCNTARHDCESAHFDLEICAALLDAYFSEAGDFFSRHDHDYLYTAIRLIPFELGLRFITDYLLGNRYFKVSDPEQNLLRAQAQFQLMDSIEHQQPYLRQLLSNHIPGTLA